MMLAWLKKRETLRTASVALASFVIWRETASVVVSSRQSVSDRAIHSTLMQIGRALIQKQTFQTI